MRYNSHKIDSFILRLISISLAATTLIALLCVITASGKTRRVSTPRIITPTGPVTVGTLGNEPIVTMAPDGTLYISALQHFYRSTDGGATWGNLAGPPESQVNLNMVRSTAQTSHW